MRNTPVTHHCTGCNASGVGGDTANDHTAAAVASAAAFSGTDELKQQLLQYMAEHSSIAKYQLPDDVVFVPEIPHNATGKISKISLRRMFKDYQPPSKQRSRL
jgi:fatty-acyl-CoA synthase